MRISKNIALELALDIINEVIAANIAGRESIEVDSLGWRTQAMNAKIQASVTPDTPDGED